MFRLFHALHASNSPCSSARFSARSLIRGGLLALFLAGAAATSASCALTPHPVAQAPLKTRAPRVGAPDAAALAEPGPVELRTEISATWAVDLSGLLDLNAPEAKAAGLQDVSTPIVLPVHVLTHPRAGAFIVDTGVDAQFAADKKGPTRGLITDFVAGMQVKKPLRAILADVERRGVSLAGVLMTHMHLDHVLGLPDVPPAVPVYIGPHETDVHDPMHALMRGTYDAVLEGRPPLLTLDFQDTAGSVFAAVGIRGAIDLVGDGSLWALAVPGHTPGSVAYFARTTAGPVLFTGDTSHTLWGWAHGVTPGTFTGDHVQNAESLRALKALAAAVPGTRVFVGHETDGVGTGVAAAR